MSANGYSKSSGSTSEFTPHVLTEKRLKFIGMSNGMSNPNLLHYLQAKPNLRKLQAKLHNDEMNKRRNNNNNRRRVRGKGRGRSRNSGIRMRHPSYHNSENVETLKMKSISKTDKSKAINDETKKVEKVSDEATIRTLSAKRPRRLSENDVSNLQNGVHKIDDIKNIQSNFKTKPLRQRSSRHRSLRQRKREKFLERKQKYLERKNKIKPLVKRKRVSDNSGAAIERRKIGRKKKTTRINSIRKNFPKKRNLKKNIQGNSDVTENAAVKRLSFKKQSPVSSRQDNHL